MAQRLRNISVWAVLLAYAAVVALPIYIMVVSSMKSTRDIYASPLSLPAGLNLNNFTEAWEQAHFSSYFLNSVIVTVSSVVLILVVSVAASYPMSRYRMRWLSVLLLYFLLGLMLPMRLGTVQLFLLFRDLGQLDSLSGLILIYVGIRIPFAVFVLTSFMRTIPRELEEAARIDGASEWQILRHIFVPLVRPAIAIVGVFSAIAVWNDFFFPLIFIYSDANKTIPLGLATFMGQYRSDWGLLFAGLTIAAIPLIVLYLFTSKQVREGIATGGMR
jgi:raffinose/stachyose/melibiose transport system permease protein